MRDERRQKNRPLWPFSAPLTNKYRLELRSHYRQRYSTFLADMEARQRPAALLAVGCPVDFHRRARRL